MPRQAQGSIVISGYRDLDASRFPGIVRDLDHVLQQTDAQPRRITWPDRHIAMIDRDGTRIALGFLLATPARAESYLILAVGHLPPGAKPASCAAANIHMADRLLLRLGQDMPHDTIMRAETRRAVDADLMLTICQQLDASPPGASRTAPPAPDTRPGDCYMDLSVIHSADLYRVQPELPSCLTRRAEPTEPLRLTVHLTGLLVMLTSAPLGAFMFTYSLLRDMAGNIRS